jgi:hypothetical protein
MDRYMQAGYAERLARLLGHAACASLVVGRALDSGAHAVFDDGDEVVQEDAEGMPVEILVADHTGAFGEYQKPLEAFAATYARPVNKRDKIVPNPKQFGELYLAALAEQFSHLQADYRKRRRAFDTFFKHCAYDPRGSFGFRWECVLRRLDQTDVKSLTASIRALIPVLSESRKPPSGQDVPSTDHVPTP